MSIRREDFNTGFSPGPFFYATSLSVSAQIHDRQQNADEDYHGPAVVLPVFGGKREERAGSHRERFLTHGAAVARVEVRVGTDNLPTVLTHASVSDLWVLNPDTKLHAESMVAETTAKRSGPLNEFITTNLAYSKIVLQGGQEGTVTIKPEVDESLLRISTLKELQARYAKPSFFKSYKRRFLCKSEPALGSRVPRAFGQWSVCSAVKYLTVDTGGVERRVGGHIYSYRGMGTLVFGEMMIQESHRRLTALRIYLGSAFAGSAEICGIDHNSN